MVACEAEPKRMLQREDCELDHKSGRKAQLVSKEVGVALNYF
jgi:hypothetical protein